MQKEAPEAPEAPSEAACIDGVLKKKVRANIFSLHKSHCVPKVSEHRRPFFLVSELVFFFGSERVSFQNIDDVLKRQCPSMFL